jgi:hypothetical protein
MENEKKEGISKKLITKDCKINKSGDSLFYFVFVISIT